MVPPTAVVPAGPTPVVIPPIDIIFLAGAGPDLETTGLASGMNPSETAGA